ncbi:RNA exonuclease 4 [Neocloeon triangulifer]|uniref:RNA exonuclease 4 n=1 Tax=Neocloeon triangulifer TaxID=2078957 RepID=UPI00286EEC05|nr:RNA exonuclease 4 [Neocloeon triangulifer]
MAKSKRGVSLKDDKKLSEVQKTQLKAKERVNKMKSHQRIPPKLVTPDEQKHENPKEQSMNFASSEKSKPSQNWLLFKTILAKDPVKPHFKKLNKSGKAGLEKMKPNKFSNNITDVVALDCEMVGGGDNGRENLLARVSVVNKFNEVLYDSFVKPLEPITDYRTQYSGVRPSDLETGADFKEAQEKVAGLIDKRILVGHDIKNDMKVLLLSHPHSRIRDTSKYKPFKQLKSGKPSLKFLAEKLLEIKIQTGEHDSIEDAKAAMSLYMMHQKEWERLRKEKKAPRDKPIEKAKMRRNWERTNNSDKWFNKRK